MFDTRIRDSFAKQKFMTTLGARLTRVAEGEVEIELPFSDALTQQHGFLHAAVTTGICDSACGYAALTRMPPGAAVLSAEFKMNLLAPAKGERFVARGRVLKAGRTLSVCAGDVYAIDQGVEKHIATMLATMVVVVDRPGLAD